ncbi:unnamed protein product [Darwinula stevensoni]|uniref:Mucin-like domain-containing protein n=1 Tax=Darwinula stevensoni TaxID=69355 RepID=A0A7R8WZT6_9CRUS|nr:unnamed protein product [Darwinula stevensoni]CAG0880936.1 unnamed protein product [Darwinula stevensoni]
MTEFLLRRVQTLIFWNLILKTEVLGGRPENPWHMGAALPHRYSGKRGDSQACGPDTCNGTAGEACESLFGRRTAITFCIPKFCFQFFPDTGYDRPDAEVFAKLPCEPLLTASPINPRCPAVRCAHVCKYDLHDPKICPKYMRCCPSGCEETHGFHCCFSSQLVGCLLTTPGQQNLFRLLLLAVVAGWIYVFVVHFRIRRSQSRSVVLLAVLSPLWAYSPYPSNYHIQTDEGLERYFRYQTYNGQFRKEKRLEDGTQVGTYGWIDPFGKLRLYDYVADSWGYRIVQTRVVDVDKNGKPIGEPIVTKMDDTPIMPFINKHVHNGIDNTYRVPSSESRSAAQVPSSNYGAPDNEPSSHYGPPPSVPSTTYGPPPSVPQSTYGSPSSVPQSTYGPPPSVPQSTYGPPLAAPSLAYGPPPSLHSSHGPSLPENNDFDRKPVIVHHGSPDHHDNDLEGESTYKPIEDTYEPPNYSTPPPPSPVKPAPVFPSTYKPLVHQDDYKPEQKTYTQPAYVPPRNVYRAPAKPTTQGHYVPPLVTHSFYDPLCDEDGTHSRNPTPKPTHATTQKPHVHSYKPTPVISHAYKPESKPVYVPPVDSYVQKPNSPDHQSYKPQSAEKIHTHSYKPKPTPQHHDHHSYKPAVAVRPHTHSYAHDPKPHHSFEPEHTFKPKAQHASSYKPVAVAHVKPDTHSYRPEQKPHVYTPSRPNSQFVETHHHTKAHSFKPNLDHHDSSEKKHTFYVTPKPSHTFLDHYASASNRDYQIGTVAPGHVHKRERETPSVTVKTESRPLHLRPTTSFVPPKTTTEENTYVPPEPSSPDTADADAPSSRIEPPPFSGSDSGGDDSLRNFFIPEEPAPFLAARSVPGDFSRGNGEPFRIVRKREVKDPHTRSGVYTQPHDPNAFGYNTGTQFHYQKSLPNGRSVGKFGYVDPFGIRRIITYQAGPAGFNVKKDFSFVGRGYDLSNE